MPTATYLRFRTEADHALAESKNAELAFRLLAMEYYGKDERIYDPLRPDGMAEGVAEEIKSLSGAEGTLVLGAWDAARHAPSSFTYTKGGGRPGISLCQPPLSKKEKADKSVWHK